MKKIQFIFPIVFVLFFLFGCSLNEPDKGNLPSWTIRVEVPLLETEVTLEEFLEDSLIHKIPIDENGDSIFVFEKSIDIDTVTVGDQLKIDPIEKSFVQYASAVMVDSSSTMFTIGYDSVGLGDISELIYAEIGLIELDNIGAEETDPISFSDIMPSTLVSSIGEAIEAAGGSADLVVDTVVMVPQQRSISFDSFTSADVSSGYFDVTITNNLFIPLGAPIYVDVKSSIGTQIFRLVWDTEIAPGNSSTKTQDVSGMTLPGDMLVVVLGTSNGSQGQQVTVTTEDLSSTFSVGLATRDFQVTQANAIVPDQSITDTSSIALAPSETVVEEAVMSGGDLNIAVTNNLPLTGDVQLVIPSLYFGTVDSTFTQNIELETGTFSVPTADMAGWTMTMDYADQRLDYHYLITTNNTDPNSVTISQTDNVKLDLTITDIFFSEVTGQIESQTIIEEGDISIESESQIQSASISAGQMDLVINNNIGGVADVQLMVPELVRGGIGLDTVLTINPNENVHSISLIGYDLQPVSLEDQRLTYNTTTITQSGSNTYYLNDSINVAINLPELTFNAVTGYVSQEDIVEEDVIELDNDTKVETALINSGQIQLTIQNFIGLEADVLFMIDELTMDSFSLETSFQITSSTEPTQQTIDLSGYSLNLDKDDQKVNYTSTLAISSNQFLSLTLDDSIAIDVLIDTLWFSYVSGIIDTVEVEIEPVEQSIDALPEEMNGINFEHVNMYLDFDTNIGIPVLLNLTITASNEAGDIDSSSVTNWDITDSTRVIMPSAERLINIKPDSIKAGGYATIFSSGTTVDTIATDQFIGGTFTVSAPLEFEITDSAKIEFDPEKVELEIQEELKAAVLYMDIDNQFDFGSSLTVLTADSITQFDDGSADTLFTLNIEPDTVKTDSIDLDDEKLDLFKGDSLYIKSDVQLLGTQDEPSKFLSTDSLKILLYGAFRYLVDPTEQGEE